ncbi:MAG TPA: hypothetical protein VH542_08945, partial [Steroidobacteraceae bacterium]
FTAHPDREALLARIAAGVGCELTRVGAIEKRPGLRLFRAGVETRIAARGYDHFATTRDSGNP